MIALPVKIVMSTDYLDEPDEEDLAGAYVQGIVDANGDTVLYTESGYFKVDLADAEFIVAALNSYQSLTEKVTALERTIEKKNEVIKHLRHRSSSNLPRCR